MIWFQYNSWPLDLEFMVAFDGIRKLVQLFNRKLLWSDTKIELMRYVCADFMCIMLLLDKFKWLLIRLLPFSVGWAGSWGTMQFRMQDNRAGLSRGKMYAVILWSVSCGQNLSYMRLIIYCPYYLHDDGCKLHCGSVGNCSLKICLALAIDYLQLKYVAL